MRLSRFESREDEFASGARDGLDLCAAGACVGLTLWYCSGANKPF